MSDKDESIQPAPGIATQQPAQDNPPRPNIRNVNPRSIAMGGLWFAPQPAATPAPSNAQPSKRGTRKAHPISLGGLRFAPQLPANEPKTKT